MSTAPAVDHLAELVGHQHLAGADRDRALVANALLGVEVEDRDGILEPLEVERLERLRQADGGLDVEAHVAVEGDLGVGPGDVADDGQALDRQPDLVVRISICVCVLVQLHVCIVWIN